MYEGIFKILKVFIMLAIPTHIFFVICINIVGEYQYDNHLKMTNDYEIKMDKLCLKILSTYLVSYVFGPRTRLDELSDYLIPYYESLLE